jgi:hypothetical protein
MNLVSSSTDLNFVFLKSLLRAINQHVDSKEYAVVLKLTKKSKNEVINKTWIICDRERKIHEVIEQNRRHCDSKYIQCSFFIIVKLNEDIQSWFYEMKNSKHNHEVTIAESHFVHRKMTMIFEMRSDISRQLTVQTALFKILSTLRLDIVANFDSSIFKSRDIYNLKSETSSRESWITDVHSSVDARIESKRLNFFFSKRCSQSNHTSVFYQEELLINLENQSRSSRTRLHV